MNEAWQENLLFSKYLLAPCWDSDDQLPGMTGINPEDSEGANLRTGFFTDYVYDGETYSYSMLSRILLSKC